MEMMLTVSVMVIAVCMVVLSITAVANGYRIRQLAREAERLTETVRIQVQPLIQEIIKITGDVRSIVQGVERQAAKLGDAFDMVRETAQNVRDFEHTVRDRLGRPLLEISILGNGVARGVGRLWNRLFSH